MRKFMRGATIRMGMMVVFQMLLLIGFNPIEASGGYGGAGLQQDKGRVDRDKYQLGKTIYNGEFQLPENANEELKKEQFERLNHIQNKLPRSEQRRVNLTNLSGKLTKEQMEALEHFVSIRFNIRFQESNE